MLEYIKARLDLSNKAPGQGMDVQFSSKMGQTFQIRFQYILARSQFWFTETDMYLISDLKKSGICPIALPPIWGQSDPLCRQTRHPWDKGSEN